MKLFIHVWTNLEYFKLLTEWFLLSQWKKDRDIASFVMQNFPWELAETISPQYEINFMAIREIKKRLWPDYFNKIEGIYYWSDNCEYLWATKEELEQAIELFKEFNKNFPPHTVRTFTFVTPYVWDKMLERLDESLEYLNDLKIKNKIEVVVNDLWILRLLNKKYTNLKPVFWRVIHKLLKTPLIDTYWYDVHPAWELIKNKSTQEIKKLKDEIVKWQLKFYSSCEASLEEYKWFLSRYWVERVALDFMEKREDLYSFFADTSSLKLWSTWATKDRQVQDHIVWIDLYYPWALIFTGRLCDTAWINNPTKWFYATDDVCGRACNKYDIFYKVKTVWYKMIQRWNAGFRSELNLDYLPDEFIKNDNNRMVFAPFIVV